MHYIILIARGVVVFKKIGLFNYFLLGLVVVIKIMQFFLVVEADIVHMVKEIRVDFFNPVSYQNHT